MVPVVEAIVNSIEAIQATKREDGKVEVNIVRNPPMFAGIAGDIAHVEITDNGIGFTDENLDSFLETDSPYKAEIGGQGIGRLSWLKVFERAEIESVYNDGEFRKRAFVFGRDPELDRSQIEEQLVPDQDTRTRVVLRELRQEYAENSPRTLTEIAEQILDRFMLVHSDNSPDVVIRDQGEALRLNDFSGAQDGDRFPDKRIDVGGETFVLSAYRRRSSYNQGHRLRYVANSRAIKTENLSRYVPNLAGKLGGSDGYFYEAFVAGRYLDDHMAPDRSRLEIPETDASADDEAGLAPIDLSTIRRQVIQDVYEHIGTDLESARTLLEVKLRKLIVEHPIYAPLRKKLERVACALNPDATTDDMLAALDRALHELKQRIAREAREVLAGEGDPSREEIRNRTKRLLELVSETGQAALAEHVAMRKVVLDFLQRALEADSEKDYDLESVIHGLIFPRRKTNDEVEYDRHNLWLLDERLAYSEYIASDVGLRSRKGRVAANSDVRPDILILDHSFAYTDNWEAPSAIILFEFKKPGLTDYRETPYQELVRHIEAIRNGNIKDWRGRPLEQALRETPVFAYIVCDESKAIEEMLRKEDFRRAPDRGCWYKHHETLMAYFELLPYHKLLRLANQRNKILFDKLGVQNGISEDCTL